MSAPITAYSNRILNDNTNIQVYQFALYLAEYTNIAEHFYLDAALNGLNINSFIGGCFLNSPNLKYHNPNRIKGVFKELVLFNDAGLNTLGHCETQSNILKYANLVLNNAFFRSAYYLNSTSFGLKYKINNGSWITAPNQDLEGAVQDTLNQKLTYSNPLVFYPTAEKGDNIQVQSYITNSEGTFEGSIINFIAEDSIVQVDAIFRTNPQSSSGETSVDFWMLSEQYAALGTLTDQGQQSGIFAHTTVFRDIPIQSGWYVGILPDKALFVDNTGQFTQYVELAPFQWILSCGVDLDFPSPESNPTHHGVLFSLNLNAPFNIPINGRISINPKGQPQMGGFSFSGTMLQGTNSLYITTGAGFEYTGSTYYLIVTTPGHPHIQLKGTGRFI